MKAEFHEYANVFPMLFGEALEELKNDIEANGLIEPIWLYEGKILDGRNRFKACVELGISPVTRPYEGDNPLGFVISLNLNRRHLSSSQRAAIAVESIAYFESEAKKRQIAGTITGNQSRQMKSPVSQKVEQLAPNENKSAEHAAKALGTNRQYVSEAKRLKSESPEVFEKVKRGELSLSDLKKRQNPPSQGNSDNEWYTPMTYIEATKQVLGSIDLDPASSDLAQDLVGASTYYTQADNGLNKPWFGTVWLHPPCQPSLISEFVSKLCLSFKQGDISAAILLTPNQTDTQWFHKAASHCQAICFTRGRIKFLSPNGLIASPAQGQALIYFGRNPSCFHHVFSKFGFLVASGERSISKPHEK